MSPTPDPHAAVALRVARRLGEVPGVLAVVLGGSRARGVAHPDSDIDLGLYYRRADPPSVPELRRAASELASEAQAGAVTELGAWGPWVDGGAWLEIDGVEVDWLYRDLDRVERVISDCRAGVVSCDYYLGHPHGFHNHIYMAEVDACKVLVDPGSRIEALKRQTRPYPPELRQAIVRRYLYDADFMLELAGKPAARGDVFHVAGCLFRCAAALVQVLFALNERYFTNEKGAVREVEAFAQRPPSFEARLQAILAAPGGDPASLTARRREMAQLLAETRALAAGVA